MMTTAAMLLLRAVRATVLQCMPCFGSVQSIFSWPRLFGKPCLTFGWIFVVVHLVFGNLVRLSLWNLM